MGGKSPGDRSIPTRLQIFLPELCGLIEPIVVGGSRNYVDEKTGIEVTERVPQEERIAKLSSKAKAWLRLKDKKNSDKNVASFTTTIPPASTTSPPLISISLPGMQILLEGLEKAGYRLGKSEGFSKDTLQDLVLRQGRNIGTWAPGELEKLVKSGLITLVPVTDYKQWFAELPREFQDQVVSKWGPVEETSLMSWKDPGGKQYLVIPAS